MRQAKPADETYHRRVGPGRALDRVDFGSFVINPARVRGTVYDDADSDGARDAGEGPVAGAIVYLDTDNDARPDANEPTQTTDAAGVYRFIGLAAGAYRVRLAPQSGRAVTAPAGGFHGMFLAANAIAAGRDFGLVTLGSIAGTTYHDRDGDGARDPDEPGLGRWDLYLDLNGSGTRDPGEPATTMDAAGGYTFADLLPGTYAVCQPSHSRWTGTAPVGGSHMVVIASGTHATGRDFGHRFDGQGQGPPKVARVLVAGGGWTFPFLEFARDVNVAATGYAVPAGAGQLRTLPWTNLYQIKLAFTQHVSVDVADLGLRGVAVPDYAFADFAYDPAAFTATWTLGAAAGRGPDKLLLVLDGDAATGGVSAGAVPLDGEWSDGTSAYPSGDDTPAATSDSASTSSPATSTATTWSTPATWYSSATGSAVQRRTSAAPTRPRRTITAFSMTSTATA